jgi:TolB-like protein
VPQKPSIAVLPFTNMSGDPEQEYFSDGMTEDLITDLSKISSLFVIARNSTFAYKGRSVKVQEIGRDLGVRFVLEGGIRKAGNRVRITAQLIDATSGGHLWADRFDRDLTNIFETPHGVVGKIVREMAVNLTQVKKSGCAGAARRTSRPMRPCCARGNYSAAARGRRSRKRAPCTAARSSSTRHTPCRTRAWRRRRFQTTSAIGRTIRARNSTRRSAGRAARSSSTIPSRSRIWRSAT